MSAVNKHAVIMLCYNQLSLTQNAMASLLAQDIGPLDILVVNNGSTDGTGEWLAEICRKPPQPHYVQGWHNPTNESPVAAGNRAAEHMFLRGYSKILGVANDVSLPPNAYRLMNQWRRGIVTASQTADPNFPTVESTKAVSEHTPMAVMITRKWVWDALVSQDGYFLDEGYFNYASDCDLALRLASCGIRGIQLDLPYWHYGSATWKLTSPEDQRKAQLRADADREYFERKWGFKVDSSEYGRIAGDPNFKGVGL
jgi:GT2 family glycosyltransferase